MALSISQARAVSKTYFNQMLIKTVYEASPFFSMLKARKRIFPGGIDEQVPIRFRKLDQSGFVDPNDAIDFTAQDTRTAAVIKRRYVAAQNLLTWEESTENEGQGKIINLMKDKAQELKEDFEDLFHGAIYASDATGKGIDPITTLVDDGDLYGVSVSAGDADMWKSKVVAANWTPKFYGASSTDGSQSLDQLINETTFGKKGPTHAICSRQTLSNLKAMYITNIGRLMVDEATLKLGYRNFMFNGLTFVSDYACPDALLLGLDMDSIGCKEDKGQPFVQDWFSLEQRGLPHHMARLMTWSGNLFINQRRTSFKIEAVQTPAASGGALGALA